MVHGCVYSAQYEIHLTQPLDLFDHVLPLCIKTRKMIEYEEKDGTYKLVILNYKDLEKRFDSNPLTSQYIKSMCGNDYSDGLKVLTYSTLIKNNPIDLIPMCDDEFNQLVTQIEEMEDAGDWTKEFVGLCKLRHIQQIVRDQAFESIVQMEQSLTTIELTAQELEIIETIKSSEVIAPAIKFAGINLCQIIY